MISGRAIAKPVRSPANPWILEAVREMMTFSPASTMSVIDL
jgi:hypothetical protein